MIIYGYDVTAHRYAWTIASNLLVFVLTAFVLRYGNKDSERVTPNDAGTFQVGKSFRCKS